MLSHGITSFEKRCFSIFALIEDQLAGTGLRAGSLNQDRNIKIQIAVMVTVPAVYSCYDQLYILVMKGGIFLL